MGMDFPLSHLIQEILVAASVAPTGAGPAEPPTQCEIRLPRWCIAGFDGRVEATDSGRYRTWALHSRLYMDHGPLLIVEDKTCSGHNDTIPPRGLPRLKLRGEDGKEYISASYVIGAAEGCKLEFRIPIAGAQTDPTYEQTLKSGILVCTRVACNSTLHKF